MAAKTAVAAEEMEREGWILGGFGRWNRWDLIIDLDIWAVRKG